MKKLFFSLLVAIFTAVQIFAYDFSAVSPSGHTLYYEYVSKSDKTVRVTFELWNGTDAPYNTTPSGEITIPSTVTYEETTYSVTEIASYAFFGCNKITSVTIQEGITIIMDDAFDECSKLQSVYLPNSLKTLKSWVFRACEKLKNIELPNSLSTIEASCFSGCKSLETITLPSSIKTIENYTFSNCENLTSITFPDGLLQIKEGAFHNCKKLSSITLPNSLTKIGKHAFDGIGEVVSISIPESVTEIGEEAFISYIEYFFFNSTIPPSISGAIFPDVAQIFVPCDAINNYLEHEDWEPYKERLKATLHKAAISYNIYPGSVSIKEVDGTACDNEYTLLLTASLKDYDTQYYQFGGWSDGNKENPRTVTITKDTSFTAIFGEKPQITNIQKNNPICTSATGGVFIAMSESYGVQPFTFIWNDGEFENPRIDMVAGNYTLVVKDALGFTSDTAYITLSANENNMPSISYEQVNPLCETNNGEITATVTGGEEPYTYNWRKQAVVNEAVWNFENGVQAVEDGLDGTAALFAATNFNNSSEFQQYDLTPSDNGAAESSKALHIQIATDSVLSFKVELPFRNDYTPIYGNEPNYEEYYDQFNIAKNTSGLSFYHKGSALKFYVLDKDLQKSTILDIPYHLNWTLVTFTWSQLTTNDVVAIVFASTAYEYQKKYDFSIDEVSMLMYDKADDYSEDLNLTDLSAGKYVLTVSDMFGCAATQEFTLNKDYSLHPLIMLEPYDPICENPQGSILTTVYAATESFTYLWEDGSTGKSRHNLAAGDYSVTVTDENGCSVSATTTLEKDYRYTPKVAIDKLDPICTANNGQIFVTANEGFGDYTYDWSTTMWQKITDFERGAVTKFATPIVAFDDSETIHGSTNVSNSGVVADGANGTGHSFLLKATDITPTAGFLGIDNAGFTVTLGHGMAISGPIRNSLGVSFYHKGDACGVEIPGFVDIVEIPEHSDWTFVTVYWERDLGIDPSKQEIIDMAWVFRRELSPNTNEIEFQIDEISLLMIANTENGNEYMTDLATGDYVVKVTDDFGCVSTKIVSLAVDESEKPVIHKEFSNAICGHDVGEISISYENGAGMIQYSWDDTNEKELKRENLAPGTYIFNISDEYGCKTSDTTEIVYESFKYQPEIALVTVSQEQSPYNLVVWQKEETQALDFYSVYRETETHDYAKLADVKYNETSIFVDEGANSQKTWYRYKISATDNCGKESELSSSHRTMYLQKNKSIGKENNLKWTPYEGFSFLTYSIYRITKDGATEIDKVNSDVLEYTDLEPAPGTISYYVGVVLPKEININDPFQKAESGPFSLAISNIAEIENQGTAIASVGENTANVYPSHKAIVVENAGENPITICNALGQTIARAKGENDIQKTFAVEAGIYIVIVGNKVVKVVVE